MYPSTSAARLPALWTGQKEGDRFYSRDGPPSLGLLPPSRLRALPADLGELFRGKSGGPSQTAFPPSLSAEGDGVRVLFHGLIVPNRLARVKKIFLDNA